MTTKEIEHHTAVGKRFRTRITAERTPFVARVWLGTTKGQLLTLARKRGWRPNWERLHEVVAEAGVEVDGCALVSDGCVVPLTAHMRRVLGVVKLSGPRERDERQVGLF